MSAVLFCPTVDMGSRIWYNRGYQSTHVLEEWIWRGCEVYTENRETEVLLIQSLLREEQTLCPKCGQAVLEHFHKKKKKSNVDYLCPACGERYRVIEMMEQLDP